MKITKEELTNIIKEEVEKALKNIISEAEYQYEEPPQDIDINSVTNFDDLVHSDTYTFANDSVYYSEPENKSEIEGLTANEIRKNLLKKFVKNNNLDQSDEQYKKAREELKLLNNPELDYEETQEYEERLGAYQSYNKSLADKSSKNATASENPENTGSEKNSPVPIKPPPEENSVDTIERDENGIPINKPPLPKDWKSLPYDDQKRVDYRNWYTTYGAGAGAEKPQAKPDVAPVVQTKPSSDEPKDAKKTDTPYPNSFRFRDRSKPFDALGAKKPRASIEGGGLKVPELPKLSKGRPVLVNKDGRRTSLKTKDSQWKFRDGETIPVYNYIPGRGQVDDEEGLRFYGISLEENKTMKITKEELTNIIKEEVEKALNKQETK